MASIQKICNKIFSVFGKNKNYVTAKNIK